ncbi:hypothetical protein [Rhodohalobacter sp. 614A]|uniref:hypothetical protein n=1 Tax=Rhodohalobacter sp. 614A TaxID=2908649 RepID=UPI001F2D9F43|nr:hypothetical protein [Rhodohalobacter sp. 614A]
MEIKSAKYRFLTRVLTAALLVAILLPSALQAKHLVDFCMTDMHHHEMMGDSHDCCTLDTIPHSDASTSHDCDNGTICACPVNEAPSDNQFRIPKSSTSGIILSPTGFNFRLISPDEFLHKAYFAHSNPDDPPLYLLYDTFLK